MPDGAGTGIGSVQSLQALSACLHDADRLTEQAFLQLAGQVEDGYRRALELAVLVDRLATERQGEGDGRLASVRGRRPAELAGYYAELVAALQFQDITRQRMDHVRAAFAELCRGGAAAATALGEVCRLQHEQLQTAGSDFLLALGRIDSQLEQLATAVETLADAARAAGAADSGRQAAELGASLRAARAGAAIGQEFLARTGPVLASLETMARECDVLVSAEVDRRILDRLQERYTMMRERHVHRRFVEGEAREPRPGDAGFREAQGQELDGNVELF